MSYLEIPYAMEQAIKEEGLYGIGQNMKLLSLVVGVSAGVMARESMAKAIVNVYVQGDFRCSGVFYNGLVLTTPTHILGYPNDVLVGANSGIKPQEDPSPRYGVMDIYFHPEFSQLKDNNLVLLKPIHDHQLPYTLFEIDPLPFVTNKNYPSILMGWGFISNLHNVAHEEFLMLQPHPCLSPPSIRPKIAIGEAWFRFDQTSARTIVEGSPIFTLNHGIPLIHAINYREPALLQSNHSDLVFINVGLYLPWIKDVINK
ncbi:hypothetical protein DSO57_1028007 [Entomophthora muscae]|uniref:Uncharacterized protein n=1 Tax=Entomophthora muscae TaxID=34485 RepID=A0ACC2SEH6_9FUNG|nr:hypothetical protein DSO57_1028007 [Entomophthora muscae]